MDLKFWVLFRSIGFSIVESVLYLIIENVYIILSLSFVEGSFRVCVWCVYLGGW